MPGGVRAQAGASARVLCGAAVVVFKALLLPLLLPLLQTLTPEEEGCDPEKALCKVRPSA